MYVSCMYVSCLEYSLVQMPKKRATGPLDKESEAAVRHLAGILGTKVRSSGRATWKCVITFCSKKALNSRFSDLLVFSLVLWRVFTKHMNILMLLNITLVSRHGTIHSISVISGNPMATECIMKNTDICSRAWTSVRGKWRMFLFG